MFKALLLVLVVTPNQAVPVSVMPYATMDECKTEMAVAVELMKENVPAKMPYVATCAEIKVLPEKVGVKI